MSEKRRDNRGRVLRFGESQRQDGRYAFKYKDNDGSVKFVYSWRLDKNDRIAMSAAVAACLCREPAALSGAECVAKSYPRFWEDWDRLKGGQA